MMDEECLRALSDDIKAHGQHNAIVLLGDLVLDGRNRLRACELAGVEPRFCQWNGDGSPTVWVVSQNLHRRHLTASQLAAVAVEILPHLEREAAARRRATQNNEAAKSRGGKSSTTDQGKARDQAAELVGVNPRYVSDAKRIAQEAPEEFEAIKRGEKTISEVKRAPAVLVGKGSASMFETKPRRGASAKSKADTCTIALVVPKDVVAEVMEALEAMGFREAGERAMRLDRLAINRRSA